jgi:hypothetical protein
MIMQNNVQIFSRTLCDIFLVPLTLSLKKQMKFLNVFQNLRQIPELFYEYFNLGTKEMEMMAAKRREAEIELARAIKVSLPTLASTPPKSVN